MKYSVGDRMKNNYEKAYSFYLPWRTPVIIRLDGKNFHSFTRGMERPFDKKLRENMQSLTKFLCEEVHTTVFGYSQSDEISLLLHPYKKLDSEPYFRNEIQKIASITAGLASAYFSNLYHVPGIETKIVIFDSRVFVLPEAEVVNYFIWRQQDASSNSVSMVAQSKFSHKELQGKGVKEMQEMMFQKDGTNWDKLPIVNKRGFSCYKKPDLHSQVVHNPENAKRLKKDPGLVISPYDTIDVAGWYIDKSNPIFSKNRNYIHKWLKVEED